ELQVLAFEKAWQSGSVPSINDYLAATGRSPRERHALLVELISIDLEFRWKWDVAPDTGPRSCTLEDYLRQFPDLGSLDEIPL
ncbi:hypothetical protein, partial [Klebsiella pneumoniae]|uniref:hypothetical protein n=1 Tax=Klebsiella pneumoniae TaxID=573 RepID=UPI003F52471B